MKNFLKEIKERVLIYDGSKGYMLQQLGLKGGECPELWNAEHEAEVRKVYTAYKEAGADVIQTNTFQGSRAVLEKYGLGERTYELNLKSAQIAREVMGRDGYVAASIGPIGKLFEPSGDLTFEKAYQIFKEQVQAVVDGGVDLINFETFTDLAEMRAALLAARDVCNLPVICSMAFETNGRTLMGTDPYTAGVVLKSLGADMIGTNCSFGPEHMRAVSQKMGQTGGIFLSAKPNAGLPEVVDGKTVYKEPVEKFALLAKEFVQYGVRLLGGCCGTTPDYIRAIKESIRGVEIPKMLERCETIITSNTKNLSMDQNSSLETGSLDTSKDPALLKALSEGDVDYVTDAALDLASESYDAIYIQIDDVKGDEYLLAKVVNAAQGYIREPFILKTSDTRALGHALRIYRGKAGVIVDGCDVREMEELLIAAKKYGSTIVDRSLLK